MKLHTSLTGREVKALMDETIRAGQATADVHFVTFDEGGSRSHRTRFEIQLGTYDKTTGPTNSRNYKNSGTHGAGSVWAATYDEWGWFMARVFQRDPLAKFGQGGYRTINGTVYAMAGYNGVSEFNAKTERKFILPATDLVLAVTAYVGPAAPVDVDEDMGADPIVFGPAR